MTLEAAWVVVGYFCPTDATPFEDSEKNLTSVAVHTLREAESWLLWFPGGQIIPVRGASMNEPQPAPAQIDTTVQQPQQTPKLDPGAVGTTGAILFKELRDALRTALDILPAGPYRERWEGLIARYDASPGWFVTSMQPRIPDAVDDPE